MSSCPLILIVLMALTSLLMLPGNSGALAQTAKPDSVADLLIKDEIQQAEALLDKEPRTAASVAFRGEIEFRRGNFDRADALYKEALKMDLKTARAHFGLGKLALGKVNSK